VAGTFECDNESSGSIKCGEILHYLRTCQLLRKDCWIVLVFSQSVTEI
jgi:hypothetical protein